jgi:hypothetical protein
MMEGRVDECCDTAGRVSKPIVEYVSLRSSRANAKLTRVEYRKRGPVMGDDLELITEDDYL